MKWLDFINSRLDEKQVEVLRQALKVKAPVHFYGYGLGKSILADILTEMGFIATAPESVNSGIEGPCAVPVDSNVICFHLKKGAPEYVPQLRKVLIKQKDEIIQWTFS